MNKGFIKLQRSEEVEALATTRPTAFVLLTLIALRARRKTQRTFDGRQMGEAYIGDYESYGVTEQIYRTDKKFLESNGLITTQVTNRGTIAKLVDTSIFDINVEATNDPANTQLTTSQRPANDQLTTNKNIKKEKKEKKKEITNSNFNFSAQPQSQQLDPSSINYKTGELLPDNYGVPLDKINFFDWTKVDESN